MVIINTIVDEEYKTLDEDKFIVNPVIYSDVDSTKLNKLIYSKSKKLKHKIKETLDYYNKRKFSKLRIKIKSYAVTNNISKRGMFVINLVIGKENSSMSYLEESLIKLSDIGRSMGCYKLNIYIADGFYGKLDIKKVVKLYVTIFIEYPGILNLITKNEQDKIMVQKIVRKNRHNKHLYVHR